MEIFLLLWLLFSIGVGVLASQRGRSGLGWGLLSLVTSPLLAIIILLLMKDLVDEAAAQEREAMRHREQMAALSGASQRSSAPQVSPLAPVGAPPTVTQAPLLIADELEKLASLKERGLLTADEFADQKARLLSGSASTGRAVPVSATALPTRVPKAPQYQLTSLKDYKDALTAQGCQVTDRSHGGWSVRKPNGTIEYAETLVEMSVIYERL